MKILRAIEPNHFWSKKTIICNSAKLPLSINKGTEAQRYELASKYSKELKERLDKNSNSSSCSVESFRTAIDEILSPHKINFDIQPQTNTNTNTNGSITKYFDTFNNVSNIGVTKITQSTTYMNKYILNLPLSKDKKTITNKYTALHEARHMFDYICNPKTIDYRSFKLLYSDGKLELHNKIYDSFVRDYQPFYPFFLFKKNAKKNLAKMSDEEAIDTLQTIRQTIKSEINAYSDTDNYLKEKRFNLRNISHLVGSWDFQSSIKFNKKLKFANELLRERLSSARNNLNKTT